MRIEAIPARDLPTELVARWDEIVRSTPELDGPYFRPEFTQAIAQVRNDVEVGVFRDGSSVVGFFPFQRTARRVARPVGGWLSDYQAVIASPELPWRVEDILRGSRLRAWEFDHHLACQRQLASYSSTVSNSWQIVIAPDFDDYIASRKGNGAGMLATILRKSRKLQREHQVRFEWHATNESVFDQILKWKSDQYRRSEFADLFAYEWIVTVLRNIWQAQTQQFAGVLGALYVDDQPAAIHLGMRSEHVLHYWFPAYDPSLAKYSCGAILLLFMIEHARKHGITLIDLGKGDQDYKLTFANMPLPLAEGIVETRRFAAACRRGWQQARQWVHRSPLRSRVTIPLRWYRNLREWIALR